MGLFDDLTFVGLDDRAVEDTGDGDGGECLDAYTDGMIRHNVRKLTEDGSRVVWAPYTQATADPQDTTQVRPYTSIEWTTVCLFPWICSKGLERIEVAIHGKISSQEGDNLDGVFLKTRLNGLAPGERGGAFSSTYDGVTYGVDITDEINPDLDLPEPVRSEVVTDLGVWIRGAVGSVVDSLSDNWSARTDLRIDRSGAGTLFDRANTYTATVPNANDNACMIARDDGAETPLELLYIVDDTSAHVLPADQLGLPAPSGVEILYISYLQAQSIEIREQFDLDAHTLPASRYQAEKVVRSQDAIRLATGTLEPHRRPRCIWLGPLGEPYSDEQEAPAEYPERFMRVRDESGSGVDFLAGSVVLAGEDPRVDLILNVIPVHLDLGYRHSGGLEELKNAATKCVWELDLDFEHFTGGAWTSIGSATEEVELLHFPTDPSGAWPFLVNEYLREKYVTWAIGSPPTYSSGSFYALREGQLWERDLGLMQKVRVKVPVSWTASTHEMVRFTLTATRTGTPIYGDAESSGAGTFGTSTPARLRLVCVGASMWEINRV